MTLEHKINLMPANGLEAKLRPSPRRSLAVRVITYSLAAFLSFVAAYGLSGCNDDDYTPNKHSYAIGLDNCGKKSTFYKDNDWDGHGNPAITTQACSQPYSYVTDSTDCNDGNASVNPGMTELPYNGLDDDCNSTTLDDDLDQDGYSTLTGTIDCDDSNADVYPNAPELCDLVDNQCPGDVGHGMIDEECLPEGLTGRIAFVSRNASWSIYDIFTIDADGSNKINLTNTPSFCENNPAWSPDGSKLAFSSTGDSSEIYIIDSDGNNLRQLSNVNDIYAFAKGGLNTAWSPDGRKIAFSSCSGGGGIYTVNVDGTGQTKIIDTGGCDYPPIAWSPDGKKIAVPFYGTLLILNPDGSWTGLPVPSGDNPAWSPDGKLAFDSNGEIYVINADGSNLTNLTNNPGWDGRPIWFPDGRRIIFFSNREGYSKFYVMNADGSDQTSITNNSAINGNGLSLSPDGRKIVFYSLRGGNLEIYTMNADGSNQTNITNSPTQDWKPVWSPR